MLILGLGISLLPYLTMASEPEVINLDHPLFCGSTTILDPGFRVEVEARVAAPPARVRQILSDWEGLEDVLPKAKVHIVRKQTKQRARIYRELDMPFFMPKVWIEFDTAIKVDGQTAIISFTRHDGSMKKFATLWTIEPAGDGETRLRYQATIVPPFTPPTFFIKRMQREKLSTMMSNLSRALDHRSVRAPSKCHQKKEPDVRSPSPPSPKPSARQKAKPRRQ